MTLRAARIRRQEKAASAFAHIARVQGGGSGRAATGAASPVWIIRWRKSAVRLLEDGRGFELVAPDQGTRFSHRGAAISACKDYGCRGSDYLIVEAPESPQP